ncbi:MAG: SAM-dependent methyltransferase [Dehalococcoidia bacterium]|nr:SAM-dependent methyltransferase [Dehalococcoidia bacterium]
MERPGDTFDDFALASRSTPLERVLREEIAAAGGRIPFERYMALALGHPEHGYYARADLRWGRDGDFETSPEVHPVFGYLWARQVVECWERLKRPDPFALVEVGGGSGAFMASMLAWLRERAPECFAATRPTVLDGHPRRLEEQRAALERLGLRAEHALLEEWLGRRELVRGVVISNELFDALPVHLLRNDGQNDGGRLEEIYVGMREDGALGLESGPLSTPAIAAHLEALGLGPGEGCTAEVCLAAPALMERVSRRLERGYVLTIDYGYPAAELYASWRRNGTLLAFRHHSPQPNLLDAPGLTDLTAHVDFTSLASAGARAGLEAAPLTTQARALVALGLGEAVEAARARMAEDFGAYAVARRAADTLIEPAGRGRIRVLAMAGGAPLEGLRCLEGPGD